MKQLLQKAIEKELAGPEPQDSQKNGDLSTAFLKNLANVGRGGARSPALKLCYQYLLTIPPTSVESERAFSSSGQFVTKVRSRLNDHTLNSLCFLRAHFVAARKATNSTKKNEVFVYFMYFLY